MDRNYITTKGSLFVTDPEFNSFTYPPLKLDVLLIKRQGYNALFFY